MENIPFPGRISHFGILLHTDFFKARNKLQPGEQDAVIRMDSLPQSPVWGTHVELVSMSAGAAGGRGAANRGKVCSLHH